MPGKLWQRSAAGMSDIDVQLRKRLEEMKAKIIERGEFKPNDFQLIDSLLNEFDAVSECESLQAKLEIATEALYESIEAMSSSLEDMNHYFENKCIPTAQEINQLAIADSKARYAYAKIVLDKIGGGE
jgi:predicted dinucleotide-utilizing enzyme